MPRKKKVLDPVAKAHKELANLIITPLYPAMLTKHEPAVSLINLTLATFKPMSKWKKDTASTVFRAEIRMSLLQLKEAVEKYTDEVTKKAVLKKITQLEDVTIGAKK